MSVSMCFAVNDTLKSKMKFLNDPAGVKALNDIPFRVVNQTCERCAIFDCRERVAAPAVLQKKRQFDALRKAVEGLN